GRYFSFSSGEESGIAVWIHHFTIRSRGILTGGPSHRASQNVVLTGLRWANCPKRLARRRSPVAAPVSHVPSGPLISTAAAFPLFLPSHSPAVGIHRSHGTVKW